MKRAMLRWHLSLPGVTTAVALIIITSGCAHLTQSATVDRLPDGNLRVQCETSLAECLVRAEEACHGTRYKVLAAVDRHDYRGSPSTMSESESRTAEAIVRCGHRGKSLTSDDETKLPPLAGTCPAAPAKAAETSSVCVPGTTQECLGPGACRGAQSCLADRTGFSRCDCGDAPVPAQPHPAQPHPG
jgi:hypothetical protein